MPNAESIVAREQARRGTAQRLLGRDKRKKDGAKKRAGRALKRGGEAMKKTKLGKGMGVGMDLLSSLFLDK